ncbi:MAG: 6-bladed beta-propeller, partial [Bacteroidales bacterium]|nr:6-bladed beta-propeller [Bacteroidales bacterium]
LLQRKAILLVAIMTIGVLYGFQSSNIAPQRKILKIGLEQIAKSTGSVKLSEIANGITYIKLETTRDCFFTPSQFIIRGNYIFAKDRDNGKVFLFNRQGKFISEISSIGKGPLEHLGAYNIQSTPTGDKIFLFSKASNRVSCYSVGNKKISDVPVKYPSWSFAPLANDQLIFLSPFGFPSPDSSAFFFYLQNNKGNVTKKYKTKKNIPIGGAIEIGNFFINPRNTLAYQQLCDTVFEISDKGDFTPRYLLDFGKSRMPDEVWNERVNYHEVQYDYINWVRLVETKNSLFVNFVYQKTTRVGLISLNDGKLRGFKTDKGLVENDLDGGPDFWPVDTDGSNEVYRYLQPVNLTQQWRSGEFKDKKFKSQAAHDQFIKMVTSLKEDDNPVVMIVNLK